MVVFVVCSLLVIVPRETFFQKSFFKSGKVAAFPVKIPKHYLGRRSPAGKNSKE